MTGMALPPDACPPRNVGTVLRTGHSLARWRFLPQLRRVRGARLATARSRDHRRGQTPDRARRPSTVSGRAALMRRARRPDIGRRAQDRTPDKVVRDD